MRTPFLRPRKKATPILHRAAVENLNLMDHSITAHAYVKNILTGSGDVSMFLTLALRLFIGMELINYVNQTNMAGRVLRQGLRALWFTGDRIKRKHVVGFSAEEHKAITNALCMVDNLAQMAMPTEYKRCTTDACMKVGGINLTMQSLEPYKDHV